MPVILIILIIFIKRIRFSIIKKNKGKIIKKAKKSSEVISTKKEKKTKIIIILFIFFFSNKAELINIKLIFIINPALYSGKIDKLFKTYI